MSDSPQSADLPVVAREWYTGAGAQSVDPGGIAAAITHEPDLASSQPPLVDTKPLGLADLPCEVQRRLIRAFENDQLKAKPMRSAFNGAARIDSANRTYAVAKDGSLHRVQVTEDGIYAVKKWSKAKRKKMRRERYQSRQASK